MTDLHLYAQPYDISATGFYFQTADQFEERAAKAVNDCGDPVEEFEIQFIDGERIDCALAQAWNVNQANLSQFMDVVERWDEDCKQRYIIAAEECGYDHDQIADDPLLVDIDIYIVDSLQGLAGMFVSEGLFGEIPDHLTGYIDYDAIARDLAVDFSETEIAGERLIYACG